ncbi:MAG: ATP-grasp domain-containing protein, partial [Gammaproteobacteria bacterium]
GNEPETVIRLQNKPDFFSSLAELKIAFPEVSFHAPDQGGHWLVKPRQGQGGLGIKRYRPGQSVGPSFYWQKFQPGTVHSALFLADGHRAQVVGYNTQWSLGLSEDDEFVFSGIVNHIELDKDQRQKLSGWISLCVKCFSLKGLNSLDFIKSGDRCFVLEINPRPPASMQLYDKLLTRHILAVEGVLLDKQPAQIDVTAYNIVYAPVHMRVPERMDWPEGCRDKPESGVICRKGQPVCSIISSQLSQRLVLDRLKQARQQILNQMIKVRPHGI